MSKKSWPLRFMALQYGIDLVDEHNPLIEAAADREAARNKAADATALVLEWNRRMEARADPQYWPTIGCAVRAGRPFLRLHCPACDQIGYVDLRKIVRPQETAVSAIKFYCEFRCRGQAPPPVLTGLFGYAQADDDEDQLGTTRTSSKR